MLIVTEKRILAMFFSNLSTEWFNVYDSTLIINVTYYNSACGRVFNLCLGMILLLLSIVIIYLCLGNFLQQKTFCLAALYLRELFQ